jgi:hypothetical protein
MSVGFGVTKDALDQELGRLAVGLREGLTTAARLYSWFSGQQTADLEALGYTAGEAAVIGSALGDLNTLAQIAHGEANLTNSQDFFTWADRLTGIA